MFKQGSLLKELSGVQHGFFGKKGGVSTGVYDTLNCGPASADSLDNVIENRWRSIVALGLEETKLFGLSQIHSTIVHVIDQHSSDDYHQGDALVTKEKGVSLSVLGADCAPLLFADVNAGVIGAAHAGWKGAVSGIVENVVVNMCEQGASRKNIRACIGPTIHPDAYEVREDFIQQLESLSDFPTDRFLLRKSDAIEGEQTFFDLPNYLLEQFKRSRIQGESLEIDTYTQKDEYFSFRRNTHEGLSDYGRQISLIALT